MGLRAGNRNRHSAGVRRFVFEGRTKAVIIFGTVIAVVAGVVSMTVVAAAPQYIAVCGPEDCATSAAADGSNIEREPNTAIVAVDSTGQVTLLNNNAVGSTAVSILGYFDSSNPATGDASFVAANKGLSLRYELSRDERREITLPEVPSTARTMLVQLGGSASIATTAAAVARLSGSTVPTSVATEGANTRNAPAPAPSAGTTSNASAPRSTPQADPSSTAAPDCGTSTAASCDVVAVDVNGTGTVTSDQVREALKDRAESSGAPNTPVPSVAPGTNDKLDDLVTEVVTQVTTTPKPAKPDNAATTPSSAPTAPS